jgi:hypothetical protein
MDTTVSYAHSLNSKHVAFGVEGDSFLQILDNLQEQHFVRTLDDKPLPVQKSWCGAGLLIVSAVGRDKWTKRSSCGGFRH